MENIEFINVIPNIARGFEIKEGSLVLLNFWGENKDLQVLDRFTLEIAKNGGIPIRWQQSRELIKDYYNGVDAKCLNFPDKYFEIFRIADIVIDIFMYEPRPHRDFDKTKLPLYGDYMRKLFGALNHNTEYFIQVTVPTEENALSEGIDYTIYKNSIINALNIDLNKIKKDCTELIKKVDGKNKVTIFTEGDNVLTFNLENRQWNKDDGTGDIPCGEIYIAPIEESAEGKILIPQIILEGESISNVLLEFKAGKLSDCSSEKLVNFVKQFDGDNDAIAEFGIGLNENVKGLIGVPIVDEKSKGTAHIAIGMNNMFGGKNVSQLHMDFIFKPVRLELDGEELEIN